MSRTIFRIIFTGMMLALVLLFQFFEHFMFLKELGFVSFNFTLIFILATTTVVGWHYALVLLILRFVFGPLFDGMYTPFVVIGHIILFVVGFIAITIHYFIIRYANTQQWTRHHWAITYVIIIGAIAILMSLLNAIFFVPWYFAVFDGKWHGPLTWSATQKTYATLDQFYFGIPNYWGGVITVYFVFNVINLTINFLLFHPLSKAAKHLHHD